MKVDLPSEIENGAKEVSHNFSASKWLPCCNKSLFPVEELLSRACVRARFSLIYALLHGFDIRKFFDV